MSVDNNGTPTRPGGITGRGFLPGQSGNPGGRPRGLAALVRQALGDGEDLVRFYRSVFAGDAKAVGERRITLRDRLIAGEWLASRGWGRAPVVVELPEPAAEHFTPEQKTALMAMPPELKDGIRKWLQERHNAYLARERQAAERRMMSYMPPPVGPDGNGDGPGSR